MAAPHLFLALTLTFALSAQAATPAPAGDLPGAIQRQLAVRETLKKQADDAQATLSKWYEGALDVLKKDATGKGNLDAVVATDAERARKERDLTAEEKGALPRQLRDVRAQYDQARAQRATQQKAALTAAVREYAATLEALEINLTRKGELDSALAARKERMAVAEELATLTAPTAAVAASPATPRPAAPASPAVGSLAGPATTSVGSVKLADATKERPFENTLGMRFVPVPMASGPSEGQRVLFSIWETRVKDYAAYARVKKVDGAWKTQERDKVPIGRAPDHPVCAVNMTDAKGFCDWLTEREIADGKLPKGAKYRVPTDEEWSQAAGLDEKNGGNKTIYSWGDEYPPKENKVANFADLSYHAKFPKGTWVDGYTDGFATTAPVGSFPPNQFGLFDVSGNVWELCVAGSARSKRGGSWDMDSSGYMRLSAHTSDPGDGRHATVGFRVVLDTGAPAR
ncbi:MAG TPA: SUMF1/EgtB/PvdO family nonheme iron enzyme [Chthoniobacteraceae bacterium]|jgi:formylglycine-generating enzyme required for sulfatase activity|nr:SUMF1/EgtB/PvdO family nonheme iron enzyme [Chthoniobacteraceae bacterium]